MRSSFKPGKFLKDDDYDEGDKFWIRVIDSRKVTIDTKQSESQINTSKYKKTVYVKGLCSYKWELCNYKNSIGCHYLYTCPNTKHKLVYIFYDKNTGFYFHKIIEKIDETEINTDEAIENFKNNIFRITPDKLETLKSLG